MPKSKHTANDIRDALSNLMHSSGMAAWSGPELEDVSVIDDKDDSLLGLLTENGERFIVTIEYA